MANKIPLKIQSGEVQQFQAGDTIDPAFLPGTSATLNPNISLLSVNYVLPALYSIVFHGGFEVVDTFEFEVLDTACGESS